MKILNIKITLLALLVFGCSSELKKQASKLHSCEEKFKSALDLSAKKRLRGKLFLDDAEASLRQMPMVCNLEIEKKELIEFNFMTDTIPHGNLSKIISRQTTLESCEDKVFYFKSLSDNLLLRFEVVQDSFSFEFTQTYGTEAKPTGSQKFTCLNLK